MNTELKESSCECQKCVNMCANSRPCWGTPDDIKKIIDAGYGNRLMTDWYSGESTNHEEILLETPAIVGYEQSMAPNYPIGRCTFLTENNKCELHDKGLKPIEGRMASCDDSIHHSSAMKKLHHETIINLWKDQQNGITKNN